MAAVCTVVVLAALAVPPLTSSDTSILGIASGLLPAESSHVAAAALAAALPLAAALHLAAALLLAASLPLAVPSAAIAHPTADVPSAAPLATPSAAALAMALALALALALASTALALAVGFGH